VKRLLSNLEPNLSTPAFLTPSMRTTSTLIHESVIHESVAQHESGGSELTTPYAVEIPFSEQATSQTGTCTPSSDQSTMTDSENDAVTDLNDLNPGNQTNRARMSNDLDMAEAMLSHRHERRRSMDLDQHFSPPSNSLQSAERRPRERSRTGPHVDQGELGHLFRSFEAQETQRRSQALLTSPETLIYTRAENQLAHINASQTGNSLDTPTLTNSNMSFEDKLGLELDVKDFMILAERYSKFAIGAYGTNFLKIMG
jgi:hypothetical protein